MNTLPMRRTSKPARAMRRAAPSPASIRYGVPLTTSRFEACARPPRGSGPPAVPSVTSTVPLAGGAVWATVSVETPSATQMAEIVERMRPPVVSMLSIARLLDAGVHEGLHELPLEEQERDEEGRHGHQRAGADHRPVDARLGGAEDGESDGERARLDRVGDHQRPEEVVPVVA